MQKSVINNYFQFIIKRTMKNLKKFLPLPVIALLVLAACTNPFAKKATREVVETEVTVTPAPVEEVVTPEEFVSIYGANMKCSLLKDEDNRQDCEAQINDVIGSMLHSEIVSSFDVKRCKELSGQIAADCEAHIAGTGVEGPVTNEDLAIFSEAVQGTFPDPDLNGEGEIPYIAPVYDITMCSQLKTPGYKAHCEKLIAEQIELSKMDEIIQSDDPKRCDELENEYYKIDCKLFFGIEVAPEVFDDLIEGVPAEAVPAADDV
jgi:hypothetical protein